MILSHWVALLLAATATAQSTSAPNSTSATSPDADFDLIAQRRRADLATWSTAPIIAQVPDWLSTQEEDGRWPDVDYRMGCDAQRANWPIQQHWIRVIAIASAWSGLNPSSSNYAGDETVLAAALKGIDWWFANDYTNMACIGGTPNDQCPCGTPGLWNTNWYGQVVLIPQLVSTACILVQPGNLTATQTEGCIRIPQRAYEMRDQQIPGFGPLTGANTVNVMQNSVSLAIFSRNPTILKDALDRAMAECVFVDEPSADGIHRDGSFLQHNGILYTGNYGKDLLNAFIQLESAATGTSFAAGNATREAMATMISGAEWMMFRDETDGRLKWDYNTIGRFIAFPTPDLQASSDINVNLTLLERAVGAFTGPADLSDVLSRLQNNLTSPLQGNRGFWASDYMVHRGEKFTLANKLLSKRTTNNEWANSANPWGYYTGQGTLFTYLTGREYLDIQAQWNWKLIPGTTTLLDSPPLIGTQEGVAINGTSDFVGVVSNGKIGLSAMSFSKEVTFNKAWFYLGPSVLVTSNLASSEPAITVLDNRAASDSGIQIDGNPHPSGNTTVKAKTLLYENTGYLADTEFDLTLSEEERSGNWSSISTSKLGATTQPIFSAYTAIPKGIYSYQVFPGITASELAEEAKNPSVTPVNQGDALGAASDTALGVAFFKSSSVLAWELEVGVSEPVLFLITREDGDKGTGYEITVADPTQRLGGVKVTVKGGACSEESGSYPGDAGVTCTANGEGVVLDVTLPTGGFAGASVSVGLGGSK